MTAAPRGLTHDELVQWAKTHNTITGEPLVEIARREVARRLDRLEKMDADLRTIVDGSYFLNKEQIVRLLEMVIR